MSIRVKNEFRVKTVIFYQNRVRRVNTGQTMSTRVKNEFHAVSGQNCQFQTDDSPSSAINGRRHHRHQNPRPHIYQNQSFFLVGNLARKFHRSNSNRAWATRAASGIFVNFGEIQGYFSILPIEWHSSNSLGFLMVFLIFLYI